MSKARNKSILCEELGNPERYIISIEAMYIAIESKKARRAKKGLDFNCVVLVKDSSKDELEEFTVELNKNKNNIKEGTRFQIAYRIERLHPDSGVKTNHWSSMDVLVTQGRLHFNLVDSANDLQIIVPVMYMLFTKCPDASVIYSGGQIQHDAYNCGTFVLDHVFRLAKILNLHEELAKLQNKILLEDKNSYYTWLTMMIDKYPELIGNLDKAKVINTLKNIGYVHLEQFPENFGPLLRNTQSWTRLENTFFHTNFMGNDKLTLADYVKARKSFELFDRYKPARMINNSVNLKRETIKAKAKIFLDNLDENAYQELLSIRFNKALELISIPACKTVSTATTSNFITSSLANLSIHSVAINKIIEESIEIKKTNSDDEIKNNFKKS